MEPSHAKYKRLADLPAKIEEKSKKKTKRNSK